MSNSIEFMLQRQKVLADFGDFALQSEDLDEVLHEACRLVAEAMGTSRAKVLEIERGGESLFVRAGVGWAPDVVGQMHITMSENSSESYAITAGRPIITQDIRIETRFGLPDFLKDAGVMALANVPIFLPGKRAYGLLQVDATEPRAFDEADTEFLRTYATILGPVIDRLLKVGELRSSEERYRAFVTASADVVYRMSPDWSEMRQLDGHGFLADMLEPSAFWMEGYIAPEDQATVQAVIDEAIRLKAPFELEHRVHRVDGTLGWTLSRAVPILDERGEVAEWLGTAKDVTARRHAEERLSTSEARYRTLFEAIDAGFCIIEMIFDADGRATDYRFVEANPTFERQSGLVDAVGRRIREFAPDLEEHWLDRYGRVALTGKSMRIEGEVAPLGRWFDINAFRVGAPEQRRVGVLFSDISARRNAENALRASEALFRQFADASSDVIWIRDARTLRFDYVSPAFETIYGDRFERVFSDNDVRRWARLILPADRGSALDAFRRVRRGEQVTHEFRICRPSDRDVRWIRDTTFPLLDEEGRVERIAGIGQDVTELKRAEGAVAVSEADLALTATRLTTLVEGIPQFVWRAVDHGLWIWASPQWTVFTGQPEEDSRDWGWLDALHPDDRIIARRAWEQSKATGRFEAEYRLHEIATGEHRWFQTRAAPVRDEAGGIVEWLGTSTDVQDLRQMQDRLRVLVAELQHRTRNLMGVVRSTMNTTLRRSPSLDEFMPAFRDRVDALARVNGLLSRLNEDDRVAFDDLIQAELGALGAVDEQGLGERVTLDGPRGVRLRSATVQTFALALHELATNALKYGALAPSQPAGRLVVRWRGLRGKAGGVDGEAGGTGKMGEPHLRVEWIEAGVAMPVPGTPVQGGGYGRQLIERALPYQLKAETTYELGPNGVRCTITLPLSLTTEPADA